MSETTQQPRPRNPAANPLARWLQQRSEGPSAILLGGTCVVLSALCLAVTFLNGDLAVQSGAVLLGVSLGSSGIIAFLAGDR